MITLFGLYLPFLFSGTVFIESVFSWPGMGEMVYPAITQRDTPVIMAGAVVFSNLKLPMFFMSTVGPLPTRASDFRRPV